MAFTPKANNSIKYENNNLASPLCKIDILPTNTANIIPIPSRKLITHNIPTPNSKRGAMRGNTIKFNAMEKKDNS